MYQQVKHFGQKVNFEIDNGSNNALCSKETWIKIGKLKIQPLEAQYKVAGGNPLQVLGQFKVTAELDVKTGGVNLKVHGCYQYASTEPTWWTSHGEAGTH